MRASFGIPLPMMCATHASQRNRRMQEVDGSQIVVRKVEQHGPEVIEHSHVLQERFRKRCSLNITLRTYTYHITSRRQSTYFRQTCCFRVRPGLA